MRCPMPRLALLSTIADALARAFEEVACLAAHGAELMEGVDRAVSPEELNRCFALGSRDEDDALEVLWLGLEIWEWFDFKA